MSKIIFIDPKKEPERYHVFSQLRDDGKAIIDKTDDEHRWWRDVSKNIGKIKTTDGIKLSELKIDKDNRAILPPASNLDNNIGYVLTNKGVIIKEEQKGKFRIEF